jgi:ubiquinone/menaquinone biosynthesis C-methylase UbiE
MASDPTPDESGTEQKAGVRDLFDGKAQWYFEERERDYAFTAQKALVLEMFDKDGGKVLDIGCGPGVMAADLLKRGCTVWGIDASEKMIALARAKMEKTGDSSRAHFSVGDIENLEFQDAEFDAVICMGVLEYLLSDLKAIQEMARVARPGGTVIVTVPSEVTAYQAVGRSVGIIARLRGKLGGRAVEDAEGIRRTCCIPWELDARLLRAGIRKVESTHSNVVLWPATRFLPAFPPALTRMLEPLCRVPLFGWLGTQYIVKGERT